MSDIYRSWATYGIVFLSSAIIYIAFQAHTIFLDCDSPWHIAAGDTIRSLGHVPMTDSWSFTAGDARWYNLSWLYDVIVSWLDEHAGIRGLVAINIIMAALIPCLLAKICLMRGSSILATLISCVIAAVMLKACVSIRPQQASLLVMSGVLLLCYGYRMQPSRLIWGVPILAAIWANIHGSYLVLFTIMGAFFLDSLFNSSPHRGEVRRGASNDESVEGRPLPSPPPEGEGTKLAQTYFLVSIVSMIAMMLNPLGYEIFYGSWLSLGSEYSQDYIAEWQPAQLSKTPQVFVYLLLMLTLPFFFRARLALVDIILAAFWMIMAMNSARHNVLLAVFITPVIALMLTDIYSRSQGRARRMEEAMAKDFAEKKNAMQMAGIAGIIALVLLVPPARNLIISDNLYDPAEYPVEEINYLKTEYPNSNILNTYCYGGYLIYQAGGVLRPFIDSRIDTLYPEKVKKDYFDILYFKPDWQEIVARYDVHLALFPNKDETAAKAFKHAGWQVKHRGQVATVYKAPGI